VLRFGFALQITVRARRARDPKRIAIVTQIGRASVCTGRLGRQGPVRQRHDAQDYVLAIFCI
jgi:hypothetical protein